MKLSLNKKQRAILAVAVPLLILIWPFCDVASGNPVIYNPVEYWFVGIVVISIFELFLFRDRSK